MDVELSAFERALLDRHLAGCPACRAFAADLVTIGRVLRETPPEPLERRIAVPTGRRRPATRMAVAAAVAATLAAAFAGPSGHEAFQPQAKGDSRVFEVDRDLRELRRALLKPLPVHVPGARSLSVL